jgi:solute carrier family 25 2-oxodicarboxylate transporter 21
MLPTIREIVAEGGVGQLYRGGLPEIAGLMPRASAAMSTLEFSRWAARAAAARGGAAVFFAGGWAAGALVV